MPCVREGNRRSDVALAMRHRLQWFIHIRADGLDRQMSSPPMRCLVEYGRDDVYAVCVLHWRRLATVCWTSSRRILTLLSRTSTTSMTRVTQRCTMRLDTTASLSWTPSSPPEPVPSSMHTSTIAPSLSLSLSLSVSLIQPGMHGTDVRRYNWHSAGSLGWPFPALK